MWEITQKRWPQHKHCLFLAAPSWTGAWKPLCRVLLHTECPCVVRWRTEWWRCFLRVTSHTVISATAPQPEHRSECACHRMNLRLHTMPGSLYGTPYVSEIISLYTILNPGVHFRFFLSHKREKEDLMSGWPQRTFFCHFQHSTQELGCLRSIDCICATRERIWGPESAITTVKL